MCMSNASSSMLSPPQLLEKAGKLLELFVAFHEDFDLLRHTFAPRSTSTRRSLFNYISDSTDIKLVILRDKIINLVDSLEDTGIGWNGGQQKAFQTLKADLEGKIKVTAELRRKFEGETGYKYDVGALRFKVIGNRVESTGDGRASTEQRLFSQPDALIGRDKDKPNNPPPIHTSRGMMTIRERLLQDRIRNTSGVKPLDSSRSTASKPSSPIFPVDQSKLITIRGPSSMFPGARQKAREVLQAARTIEGALQSPSPVKAGNKPTGPGAALNRSLSSPTPIPSSPQLLPHPTGKRKLKTSPTEYQKVSRQRKNRLIIPSSDDEDVENGHNEADKAETEGGSQATEPPKEAQSAGPKNNPPTPLEVIKVRAPTQVTASKMSSLGLSFRTPGATSMQVKNRAHVSSSYDVYEFPDDDDDDQNVSPKEKQKRKQGFTQVIKQVVNVSTQPGQRIPKSTNHGYLGRPQAKGASVKPLIQPRTTENRRLGFQFSPKNKLNRLSDGAEDVAPDAKRQKTVEKEKRSQASKSSDYSSRTWDPRNSSSWNAIHK
ncbi:hypothetical protein BDZ45DRAFT_299244 [Acephala macrosclerotiorum]|nr:hypothetical protein BDZ45DRAFT_299244 [Acephala macrosclerotiorum]